MKVLICGGGIAGMTTALALHKAHIDCEVFEARGSHSDGVGAFITLAQNGVSVMQLLGLDVSTIAGIDTTGMQLMLSDVKPLTTFPLGVGVGAGGLVGGDAGAGVGSPDGAVGPVVTRSVKRAELYSALRRRAEELGIPVRYGKRLVEASTVVRASGAGSASAVVTARFDDGSTATGDLLVGADGLHSRVRELIDPAARAPRYLGVLNAGGYLTAHDVAPTHARAADGVAGAPGGTPSSSGPEVLGEQPARDHVGPLDDEAALVLAGSRRWGERGVMQMMFGTKTFFSWLDDEQGGAWWFANPPAKREPARGELAGIEPEQWRRRLLQLVEHDAGPATTIIRHSSELFVPWPTHDLPKVKVWSRDRMLIIGDAAHAASPSSGQGASMAIEDAAVLALALRDSPTIDEALAVYEAVRRPRVTKIVAQGKRNGSGKTPGRLGRAMRDAFLRRMFARPPRAKDLRWLYEYPLDWERGL